jgi:capsular polysaccharide biosynthesis protein
LTEQAPPNPDEISLSELIRPIWERRVAVVLVTIVAGLIAFVVSSLLPPTFTGNATVLVGGSRVATGNLLQDLELGQRLVQSYAEIARSRSVAQRALTQVGGDTPVREFQSATTVLVVPGTLLLRISHDAVTPEQAAAGANALARALIAQLEETSTADLPLVKASIQEPALPPESRSAPRRSLNTLIGLFLGLFLGVGGASVHNALDRTVKTPRDLEALGLLSLAEIPFLPGHEKGLVAKEAPLSAAGEAYRVLRTNLRFFDLNRRTRSLTLTSTDEAHGKSTVAANLAVTVAQNDQNAYLLDCDLRRPGLAGLFPPNDKPGVVDVLLGQATVEEATQRLEGGRLAVLGSGTRPPPTRPRCWAPRGWPHSSRS